MLILKLDFFLNLIESRRTFEFFSDGCGIGNVLFDDQVLAIRHHSIKVVATLIPLTGNLFNPGAKLFGFQLVGGIQNFNNVLVPVVKVSDGAEETFQSR